MRTATWEHVAQHTDLLLTTLAGLDDAALRVPSQCEGWSRGHVITHVARNADGLGRVVEALTTGADLTMYPSDAERDREIDEGSARPVAEQRADVRDSARRLARAAAALGSEHADRSVPRTPGSELQIPGRAVPLLRLNEVVLHHIDLRMGLGFVDLDAETTDLLLGLALRQYGDTRPLQIRTTEGDELFLGDGGPLVTGSRTAVLAYLTRQLDDGVTVRRPSRSDGHTRERGDRR